MTYAKDINTLASFLGPRDLHALSQNELKQKYNITQAAVFVLFGGSILSGADEFCPGKEE